MDFDLSLEFAKFWGFDTGKDKGRIYDGDTKLG